MDLKNHKKYTDDICEDLIEKYYKKIQKYIKKPNTKTETNRKEFFRKDRYNKKGIENRIHLGSWLTDFQLYDHITWSSSFQVFLTEKDFRKIGDTAQAVTDKGRRCVKKGSKTWNDEVDEVSVFVEDLFDEILNKLPFVLKHLGVSDRKDECEGSLNYLKEYLSNIINGFREESVGRIENVNSKSYKEISNGIDFYKDTIKNGFEILLGKKNEVKGGDIASAFKKVARALAYFKFAHPADNEMMNYDSFKNICDQMLNVKNEKITELGFRGMYFPHYHFDRWPEEDTTYEFPDKLRSPHNKTVDRQLDPGIYPYMRDGIEYLAGVFSELDREWAEEFTKNLEECSSWDENRWNEWESSDDLRLAQLGHAFHVVEDYFAHSTFIEHAVKLLMYPESRPNKKNFKKIIKDTFSSHVAEIVDDLGKFTASNLLLATVPVSALFYIISGRDKDYTRFQRRFLLFEPQRKDEDGYLNSTPTDDKGNPIEDQNVVTGYFDGKDMILSLKRKIEDLFGYKVANHLIGKFSPPKSPQKSPILKRPDTFNFFEIGRADTYERDMRQLFLIVENPDKALEDLKNLPGKKIQELKSKLEELSIFYEKRVTGEYFELDPDVVNSILDPFFPEGVPTEVRGNLVQAILVLCSGWKIGNHVISVLSFIELIISLFSGKIVVELLLDIIGPEISQLIPRKIWTEIDQSIMEWFGSLRIGCHSLICKDYEDDFLFDKASDLAKATDWYILDTLLRRFESSTKIDACREGSNTVNCYKWIDWLDLLEFFLSHPGGEEKKEVVVCIPVSIFHITSEGYKDGNLRKRIYYPMMAGISDLPDPPDELEKLGPYYARTAIAPDGTIGWNEKKHGEFWKEIAKANYGTCVPREINAILRRTGSGYPMQGKKKKGVINYAWHEGTRISIPYQPGFMSPFAVKGFEDRWYKVVLDDNWEAIKEWKTKGIHDSKEKVYRELDETCLYKVKPFRLKGLDEVKKQIDNGKKVSTKKMDKFFRTADLKR